MVAARERESRAMDMRKAGATYDQIGERLGISKVGAFKAVKRVLERTAKTTTEAADDVRRIELERIDAMLLGLWKAATNGDARAVDSSMRLSKRRSELLGLDAPQRIEMSHEDRLAELE